MRARAMNGIKAITRKKLDELEEYSKTVDERLERYRQKRDYSFDNYYYKKHKKAMRTFHWNELHYQLPRKNPP
ncbi:hypothetical protein FACS1894113_2680 [Alphaproteobacteria bacterium]|nr:hypothetical protein FACS1894113_2680 [Alphaproteobacteria bacterium]